MHTPSLHLTVAAIIERESRFLLVEELIEGRLVVNQPAGHVEVGETAIQAVAREVLEETGYIFTPRNFIGISSYQTAQAQTYHRLTFSGTVGDTPVNTKLDDGIERAFWAPLGEIEALPHLRSAMVIKDLERYLEGSLYPLSIFDDRLGPT